MNILLAEEYRSASTGRFSGCTVRYFASDLKERDVLAEVMREATVVGFRNMPPIPFGRDLVAGASNLKFIQKSGSGIDWFDLDILSEHGIALAANTGINAPGVTEQTVLLTLLCIRHPRPMMDRLRQGEWWRGPATPPTIMLSGKTVGIIGMGAIGSLVAKAMIGLGARVVAYRRAGARHAPTEVAGIEWAELDDVLRQADVLTLHVPLTTETRGMIGARELALLKPGAILVNTARGPVVDEAALYEALRNGHLRAAGLDVFAEEPTPAANPLLQLENVYATPHIAGFTSELAALQIEATLSNIERFVAGQRPERLVNPEAWDKPAG